MRLPAHSAGTSRSLRYHPTPTGKNPPAPPVGLAWAMGPAMLQSWGRSTDCHDAASDSNCAASGAVLSLNAHPASNDVRGIGAAPATVVTAIVKSIEIRESNRIFISKIVERRAYRRGSAGGIPQVLDGRAIVDTFRHARTGGVFHFPIEVRVRLHCLLALGIRVGAR